MIMLANLMRMCACALLRRALARTADALEHAARRDAGWLGAIGLTSAEARACAGELRMLAAVTAVTRSAPAEISR